MDNSDLEVTAMATTTERIEITDADWRTLEQACEAEGRYAGKSAGSWVIDGNTLDEELRTIIDQIEHCEFDVRGPLSGEYADDPTALEVVNAAAATTSLEIVFDDSDEDMDAVDDLAQRWEDAYLMGFQNEVERSARAQLGDSL